MYLYIFGEIEMPWYYIKICFWQFVTRIIRHNKQLMTKTSNPQRTLTWSLWHAVSDNINKIFHYNILKWIEHIGRCITLIQDSYNSRLKLINVSDSIDPSMFIFSLFNASKYLLCNKTSSNLEEHFYHALFVQYERQKIFW